jgi:4-hydroxybenzoate polyprenyltransferase
VLLSVVALFLAGTYPLTKRFFVLPQAYLGVAFGFGIPMAFAAQTGTLPALAWLLLAANVFWALAYDTEYAMVDREDDRRIGIRTSAILLGERDVVAVMAFQALFIALLVVAGWLAAMGFMYYVGLGLAAALAATQYPFIRERDPALCFKAFLHNNWVGAAVFAGIAGDFLLRREW